MHLLSPCHEANEGGMGRKKIKEWKTRYLDLGVQATVAHGKLGRGGSMNDDATKSVTTWCCRFISISKYWTHNLYWGKAVLIRLLNSCKHRKWKLGGGGTTGSEDSSCLMCLHFQVTFPLVPLTSNRLNVRQDPLSTDHVFSRSRSSCWPPWASSSEAKRKEAVAHLTLTGQPQRGDLGSESWRGVEEHGGQQGKRAGEEEEEGEVKEGWNGSGENLRLAFDSWKVEGTQKKPT